MTRFVYLNPILAYFVMSVTVASLPMSAAAAPSVARHDMTSAEYQKIFSQLTKQGYRLREVDGYSVGASAKFAAIFDKKAGPAWVARHDMSSAKYQSEFTKHTRSGYRLAHVSGYAVAGKARYAALWEKKNGPAYIARHDMSSSTYQSEFNKHTKAGYRLTFVDAFQVGNKARFAAIWEKKGGGAWVARHNMTSSAYQSAFNSYLRQGYRLTRVSTYREGGKQKYAAIWEKRGGRGWFGRHNMTSVAYQSAFDNAFYRGYALSSVSADAGRFAAIFTARPGALSSRDYATIKSKIEAFMRKFAVPGLAFAVTKDDRLVFAQGYGWARRGKMPASPKTLFRLASISKPITSVATMKLMEQGKVRLSDRVFGPQAIFRSKFGNKNFTSRQKKITVKHLLEHTEGGWGNKNNDPMFKWPSVNHKRLIGLTMDTIALQRDPGIKYDYSNFGYCLLGRIIEARSRMSYAAYVKRFVLQPAGIRDMHIGANKNSQARANEAYYYGQGDNPDCCNVRRMDSHGGWIASAVDLLRFAVRVNGKPGKRDILSSSSIRTMTTPPSVNKGYAKGWSVNASKNWWHGGSLPGTGTILVRTEGGYTWTILMNTRSKKNDFGKDMDRLPWNISAAVNRWPSYDLF